MDVFIVIRRFDGKVLFGLRADHLYAGGEYNLVSGKVELGEDAATAAIREAKEEVAVNLRPDDLIGLGAVHTSGEGQPRVGLAFLVDYDTTRHGVVINAEPGKCNGLVWASPDDPPAPLESYNAAVLTLMRTPSLVSHGW